MRRLIAAVLLAAAMGWLTTQAQAGYLIIRVILEGNMGTAPAAPGGEFPAPGGTPPPVIGKGPKYGSGFGPPPGLIGGSGPGVPGLPGYPGMPGAAKGSLQHDPARALVVWVPITSNLRISQPFYKGPDHPVTNPRWQPKITFEHYGQRLVTNLFADGTTVQWYEELLTTPQPLWTRATQLEVEYADWKKRAANDLLPLLGLVRKTLAAGLVDRSLEHAEELAKLAAQRPDVPPEVGDFVRMYSRYRPMLTGALLKANAAETWQVQLNAKEVHRLPHYTVLTWDATPSEVQRWGRFLEENFKAFFLLHALRNVELPLPEAPLLVVIPPRAAEVVRLAKAFEVPLRFLQTDGFYVPDYDLLVLSPERLDEVGQTFHRQMQSLYQTGVSREQLVTGGGPPLDRDGKKGKKPEEVARLQTLALVEQLIEDRALQAAMSREGSRQLLYATGQLPRHVELPEWLEHGLANVYARPKDPPLFQGKVGKDDKAMIAVSVETGYGGPNYALHRHWRDMVEKKTLHPDAGQLLRNVLSDAYFRGLRDPSQVQDPDPAQKEEGIALRSGSGGPPQPGLGGGAGGFGLPGVPGLPPGGAGLPPGTGFPPGFGGGSSVGPPSLPPGGPGVPPGGPGVPPGGAAPGDPYSPYPGVGGPARPAAEDPQVILRRQRERLNIKAQATAWALCYYLHTARPQEFRAFLAELSAFPRDLPLQGETVLAAFRRAFRLDGSAAADDKFAHQWLNFMRTVPITSIDVPLTEPKPPETGSSTPGLPPGYPGLPPGYPGAPGSPGGPDQ